VAHWVRLVRVVG